MEFEGYGVWEEFIGMWVRRFGELGGILGQEWFQLALLFSYIHR